MTQASPFIAIIGAGPGGLALAQGLSRLGIRFRIYEKNLRRDDYMQAFRLSLRTNALDALQAILTPDLYDAFLATSGEMNEAATFYDRDLVALDAAGGAPSQDDFTFARAVSRITLRQILLAGIEDHIETGRSFLRYETRADQRIDVVFEDGSRETCDLLVGADGVGSRVRGQLLPGVKAVDTGARRIAAKVALDDQTRAALDPRFLDRTVVAKGSRGNNLFIAPYHHRLRDSAGVGAFGGNDEAAAHHPGLLFDNTTSYVMWAFSARADELPAADTLATMDREALYAFVAKEVSDWAPQIRDLVARTDRTTLGLIPIRSSVPVAAWPTQQVTLLGDAIHSMTYFRGQGATTALHDAWLLSAALGEVVAGRKSLIPALAGYEARMRDSGFRAVRDSMDACERALDFRQPEFHPSPAEPLETA